LLEKTNNSEPLNRFNKKCQVNINFGRSVPLSGAINQAPRNQRQNWDNNFAICSPRIFLNLLVRIYASISPLIGSDTDYKSVALPIELW